MRRTVPLDRTFLAGLLVGSTLGASLMDLVLWQQGAKRASINAILASMLLIGFLAGLMASATSRSGRDSPGKTALRTALLMFAGSLFATLFVAGKAVLRGDPPESLFDVTILALGATITLCSYLSVWLVQRKNRNPIQGKAGRR